MIKLGLAACAAAAWMACAPVQAQIYKCPGPGGRTVIQQLPCVGGQKMDVRPASGHAPAAPAGATGAAVSDGQARLEKLKRDNEMAAAIRRREPLVGMTRKQLDEAMGLPTKVNANNYQGVQQEQNIYERPDATWYVYTRNGVVESIQHRPGAPIGQEWRPPCPSAREVRDAEVSASSLTAGKMEHDRLRALRDALRDCQR